jgi:hypothetical protein
MGRCRTEMVLRTADDWEVAMGDSDRTDSLDPVNNTDAERGRAITGANIASDKQPCSRSGVRGYNGRRNVLRGGQCENFRRESRSLCLRKHCKNGTDGGIELP